MLSTSFTSWRGQPARTEHSPTHNRIEEDPLGLAEELLATTQAELRIRAERKVPRSWRAGIQHNGDGTDDVTTGVYDGSWEYTEAQLLKDHGYDPETHMITGGVKRSSWTAYKPKEYRRNSDPGEDEDLGAFTFTATAYKFKVAERPQGSRANDVDELVKALDGRTPPVVSTGGPQVKSPSSYIFAIGDLQIGKMENPLESLGQRFVNQVDGVAERLRHGAKHPHIHIAWLGDCIEGTNSQGGKLRWRTVLTVTEQVRVLQRFMMYAIEALAPLCEKLTVASVPGNHDEAAGRDLVTRADDSWAVQALSAVEDAISFSHREDLEHVECYVPGPDQQGVTLDVAGLRVLHVHGHQFRVNREYEWWKGQLFGGQDGGDADLLLHGHQHHYTAEEQGVRLRLCVPAMEVESTWWIHQTGTPGNPGSLLITVRDGRVPAVDRLY